MIHITYGNILSVEDGIIVQQVNCMGVMGAGLAKQLRSKYPGIFPAYRDFIDREMRAASSKDESTLLGKAFFYQPTGSLMIANCFGQRHYGRGLQTDYSALERALTIVRNTAKECGKTVAIPWGIGCGLAGGDWNKVMGIILRVFSSCHSVDVTIYYWKEHQTAST